MPKCTYRNISVKGGDGQLWTKADKRGRTQENAPKTEQRITDASLDKHQKGGKYLQLGLEDPRCREWRIYLGTWLAQSDKGSREGPHILSELPEGYTLWLYHRLKEVGRTDTYMYGYPGSTGLRPKRFENPAEFWLHLGWQVKKGVDLKDCPCKFCNDHVQDFESATITPVLTQGSAHPKPQAQTVATPKQIISQDLKELVYDARPNQIYLYRPGEMVWFCRGTAWGLAVISQRELRNSVPRYLIQPLSFPGHNTPPLVKETNEQLRPWLAWSIPDATHQGLQGMAYDQVDWNRVAAGAYGKGEMEVDAMIMAAKVIDGGYSLFEEVTNRPVPPGEKHYNGIFLGAEKIWVNEPIRLAVDGAAAVVLVVKKIILHESGANGSEVTIVGDRYTFREILDNSGRPPAPNFDLPQRMIADLQFRNQITAKRGYVCEWSLNQPMDRKTLKDIKGRWYETSKLLPTLKGDMQVKREADQGFTSDTAMWMNSRGDTSGPDLHRSKRRRVTLGKAVPDSFKISKGLDAKHPEEPFPNAQPKDAEGASKDVIMV